MNGHRPVFWNQGLFLHPQHFQAADDEAHQRTEPLRRYGLPFFWGLRRFALRASLLEQFVVEVENLEAVFPSGAVINAPFDCSLAPLTLERDWPEPDKPGILYVGLALPDKAGGNAAPAGSGKRFAFSEEPEMLPDAYGKGPLAPVHRLRYAPVLFRDIDLDRYSAFERLPLACLSRVGNTLALDAHFIPPLLCLDASRRLSSMMQELQNLALSSAGRLSGYKPVADNTGYSADLHFLLHFTALGILNRYVPLLDHLRAAPQTHPWHLYGVLRQLIGELSSFYSDVDCLGRGNSSRNDVPDYDHLQLQDCFEAAQGMIQRLIAGLGADAARTVTLTAAPPFFSAALPEDFLAPSRQYWLVVHAPGMREESFDLFPRLAKLGTGERISTLIAKAVSGIPLSKVRTPPPGFARARDSHWFAVDASHTLWGELARQMKISLFWEDAPETVQVQLVATGR